MSKKTRAQSYTEQIQILMQGDMNGAGRLFGGRLMEWIDVTAATCARRHSECNVTTASVSKLDFLAPAYANDTIVLCAQIVSVGRTSMNVKVETYVEKLSGKRSLVNQANLIMVALGPDGDPTPVPELDDND